ncbi:STAS domain-containing protein [Nocardiopsis mangrovi]|uniref:Anti-sigma factor antagonist n=1 Tax=Nocardiopsis mangrovi TaxID=1179818 RepID=A0ABV9DZM1_9ACTN
MPALKITPRPHDDALVLVIDGEIDMATEQLFHKALSAAIDKRPDGRVVLDCARLSFIDSSGLRVLIQGHRMAKQNHSTVSVAAPIDRVAQVLRVTAIDTRVPVFGTVDAALAAPMGSPNGA